MKLFTKNQMDESIMHSIAFDTEFTSVEPDNLVADVMHNHPYVIELLDGTILLPETYFDFLTTGLNYATEILYAVSNKFNFSL